VSTATKVLIVFCEGPHDIAFVGKVMRHCLGFEKVGWKFSEYPSPLDKLFRTSVERHAQQDLSLDMAHKFFLPDAVFERENHVVLLFNSGGKTQADKVSTLLSELLDFLELAESATYDENPLFIGEARYLFLYDADDWGLDKTCQKAQEWFTQIGDRVWLETEWQVDENYPFAAMNGSSKALYVWGETPDKGTLEDWLYPLFRQKDSALIEQAEKAVDGMFTWEVSHTNSEQAVAETSKRQKAILTLAGQREKPGSSMSVVLDQAKKRISKSHFKSDANVQAFAAFVSQFAQFDDAQPLTSPDVGRDV